jgi:hypothetical protein
LRVVKEFGLSRLENAAIEFKRDLVRQLITFLMDQYAWKGTCRVTIFAPRPTKHGDTPTIGIYERIAAGHGPTAEGTNRPFFTKGHGIPGKAWERAWSGEGTDSLVKALQIGNVPDRILADKKELRQFFANEFCIQDDKMYESLGSKKAEIRSYMAVGILGQFQRLVCVICIDSEQENQFVDFERLKTIPNVRLTSEQGVAIFQGEGLPDVPELPFPKELQPFLTGVRKFLKAKEGWEETKDLTKQVACMIGVVQTSQQMKIHAPSFLFGLVWVLRQLRDIFMTEGV